MIPAMAPAAKVNNYSVFRVYSLSPQEDMDDRERRQLVAAATCRSLAEVEALQARGEATVSCSICCLAMSPGAARNHAGNPQHQDRIVKLETKNMNTVYGIFKEAEKEGPLEKPKQLRRPVSNVRIHSNVDEKMEEIVTIRPKIKKICLNYRSLNTNNVGDSGDQGRASRIHAKHDLNDNMKTGEYHVYDVNSNISNTLDNKERKIAQLEQELKIQKRLLQYAGTTRYKVEDPEVYNSSDEESTEDYMKAAKDLVVFKEVTEVMVNEEVFSNLTKSSPSKASSTKMPPAPPRSPSPNKRQEVPRGLTKELVAEQEKLWQELQEEADLDNILVEDRKRRQELQEERRRQEMEERSRQELQERYRQELQERTRKQELQEERRRQELQEERSRQELLERKMRQEKKSRQELQENKRQELLEERTRQELQERSKMQELLNKEEGKGQEFEETRACKERETGAREKTLVKEQRYLDAQEARKDVFERQQFMRREQWERGDDVRSSEEQRKEQVEEAALMTEHDRVMEQQWQILEAIRRQHESRRQEEELSRKFIEELGLGSQTASRTSFQDLAFQSAATSQDLTFQSAATSQDLTFQSAATNQQGTASREPLISLEYRSGGASPDRSSIWDSGLGELEVEEQRRRWEELQAESKTWEMVELRRRERREASPPDTSAADSERERRVEEWIAENRRREAAELARRSLVQNSSKKLNIVKSLAELVAAGSDGTVQEGRVQLQCVVERNRKQVSS